MLAPFGVKISTRMSCWSSSYAKTFCELFVFHRYFRKNMYFTRFFMEFSNMHFHEKIITFLFVTLSHTIKFSSNFSRRRKIELLYWISTFKYPMIPFPCFFWKHEISIVPGRLKIEKSMIFLSFSFVPILFLIVKSRGEHVFASFRAIWCRTTTLFDDLE